MQEDEGSNVSRSVEVLVGLLLRSAGLQLKLELTPVTVAISTFRTRLSDLGRSGWF